jgi:TfoX/Sxy family transcriptional regulator of competence genes
MAYDKFLVERITGILNKTHISFESKNMMGGICFMVEDKMLAGVFRNRLMARIDPVLEQKALQNEYCSLLDSSGKSMHGFIYIDAEGVDMDEDLEYWLNLCLEFNPRAVSSKKKK